MFNSLASISLAIFVIYVVSMIIIFGVPASISDTYYLLEKKKKGCGWLFTAALLGIIFTLMPALLHISDDSNSWPIFLACAALGFVAVAPEFKSGLDRKVHISATVVCALFSQIWVFTMQPAVLSLWVVCILGVIYLVNKEYQRKLKLYGDFIPDCVRVTTKGTNVLFWVEITAFLATYLTYYISVFFV